MSQYKNLVKLEITYSNVYDNERIRYEIRIRVRNIVFLVLIYSLHIAY